MKNKICDMCGNENTTTGKHCNSCYAYLRKHPEGVYTLPKPGEIKYAPNGDPICHICGQAHRKLGNHIKFKHRMSQQEYRDEFKLYRNTRLSNYEYQKTMAGYNKKYRETVVMNNLIEKGKSTRITSDKVFTFKRKYGKPILETFIKKS
jgi:hypothetical protein